MSTQRRICYAPACAGFAWGLVVFLPCVVCCVGGCCVGGPWLFSCLACVCCVGGSHPLDCPGPRQCGGHHHGLRADGDPAGSARWVARIRGHCSCGAQSFCGLLCLPVATPCARPRRCPLPPACSLAQPGKSTLHCLGSTRHALKVVGDRAWISLLCMPRHVSINRMLPPRCGHPSHLRGSHRGDVGPGAPPRRPRQHDKGRGLSRAGVH